MANMPGYEACGNADCESNPRVPSWAGIENERLTHVEPPSSTLLRPGQLGVVDMFVFTALFAIGICAVPFFSSSTDGATVTIIITIGGIVGALFIAVGAVHLLGGLRRLRTQGIVCEHDRVGPGSTIQVVARFRVNSDVFQATLAANEAIAAQRWPVGTIVNIAYPSDRPNAATIIHGSRWGRIGRVLLGVILLGLAIAYGMQVVSEAQTPVTPWSH